MVAACWFSACLAADPAKDPAGWGDLRFGMTAREVVDAMGVGVFLESPDSQEKVHPFKSPGNDVADLTAATSFVDEALSSGNKDHDQDPDVLDACRKLRGLLKPRSWTVVNAESGMFPSASPQRTPKVTATLENIFNSPGGYKMLSLRTAAKKAPVLTIHEHAIDEKSRGYLEKVTQAVDALAAVIVAKKDNRPAGEDDAIDPAAIHTRDITVRGITLKPKFTFTDGRLVQVNLGIHFAGDGGFNFDHRGVHDTLCEALVEKYGVPNERNRQGNVEEMLWRFPKTVVRCARYERDLGSGFVRKGVYISYEMPSEENTSGGDNL